MPARYAHFVTKLYAAAGFSTVSRVPPEDLATAFLGAHWRRPFAGIRGAKLPNGGLYIPAVGQIEIDPQLDAPTQRWVVAREIGRAVLSFAGRRLPPIGMNALGREIAMPLALIQALDLLNTPAQETAALLRLPLYVVIDRVSEFEQGHPISA